MDQEHSTQDDALDESGKRPVKALFAGLEDFRTTQPKVIGDVLRQLMGRKDFLTVESNQRPDRIVTRILAVDQAAGMFIYDASPDETHNRCLMEAQENYFSGTQDGIRIQFIGNQPRGIEFEGTFAFCAPLPLSLYRVQRREFFRAAAPLVESYCCHLALPDQHQVTLDIVDLSLDGVGLRSKDPSLDVLQIGSALDKVVLNFGKRGKIETGLRITYLRNLRDADHPAYRIGCRFANFPKSREQELQRLITYLELARRGRD
jgi:c-di-GMP-binding flagellar brake protein YcgR